MVRAFARMYEDEQDANNTTRLYAYVSVTVFGTNLGILPYPEFAIQIPNLVMDATLGNVIAAAVRAEMENNLEIIFEEGDTVYVHGLPGTIA